ncbi:MAG: SHOCT domain-containing protein [Solirubrobacterales bacterium]
MIAAALYFANSGWDGHMDDWGPGAWILMGVMMIVFWGLVIAGVVWLVRYMTQTARHREPSALDLLDRRLASGEVSVEEYEERRKALTQSRGESGS